MEGVDWKALGDWLKNAVPWAGVATWAGIALNFYWNWRNHQRAKTVRSDGIRLDEFKRLRSQTDSPLSALRVVRGKLHALEASGQGAKQLRDEITALNQQASAACADLQLALSDLDQSKFAEGVDWLSGVSEATDALFGEFDKAYSPLKKETQILTTLSSIVRCVDDLCSLVRKRLDRELERYS